MYIESVKCTLCRLSFTCNAILARTTDDARVVLLWKRKQQEYEKDGVSENGETERERGKERRNA